MTTENKCPSYYAINIPEKNITIEVNEILKALYRSVSIVNLKDIDGMKWNYYCNAVEYLLRALRKGQFESDLKKAIHEIELFLDEM